MSAGKLQDSAIVTDTDSNRGIPSRFGADLGNQGFFCEGHGENTIADGAEESQNGGSGASGSPQMRGWKGVTGPEVHFDDPALVTGMGVWER